MKESNNLEIDLREGQLHLVEHFVEKICDQYNIYNESFGVILSALSEFYEAALLLRENKSNKLEIGFFFDRGRLVFRIHPATVFYSKADIWVLEECDLTAVDLTDRVTESMLKIKLYADEIAINNSDNAIEARFDMSNINRELEIKRNILLESYYNQLQYIHISEE